jgi:hypothetical protein
MTAQVDPGVRWNGSGALRIGIAARCRGNQLRWTEASDGAAATGVCSGPEALGGDGCTANKYPGNPMPFSGSGTVQNMTPFRSKTGPSQPRARTCPAHREHRA